MYYRLFVILAIIELSVVFIPGIGIAGNRKLTRDMLERRDTYVFASIVIK